MFPEYSCRGTVETKLIKEIKSKVMALFAVKITSVIYNSVDSIVISAFLGLVALAKYNNYYYIMSAIISIVTVLFTSITSSISHYGTRRYSTFKKLIGLLDYPDNDIYLHLDKKCNEDISDIQKGILHSGFYKIPSMDVKWGGE